MKHKSKKNFIIFFIILISIISLFSYFYVTRDKKDENSFITAVGSTSFQPFVEKVSEDFSKNNKDIFITVQGGGSGSGLSQVQSGAVQIGNSDLAAKDKDGIDPSELNEYKIAGVGITPIVNKSIGIKNISLEDLGKIFKGEITNWKDIDGKTDQEIVVINRAAGSGTRMAFEDKVLNGENTKKFQEQDNTGLVKQIVSSTKGSISYASFPYIDKSVKTLNINNVSPNNKNVINDSWKIWSYEYMYTKGEENNNLKQFMKFISSDDVQKNTASSLGYIPIKELPQK